MKVQKKNHNDDNNYKMPLNYIEFNLNQTAALKLLDNKTNEFRLVFYIN